MGRHATREAEIDRMLRAELFVDLYAVVKHSLRASVERYSIKDLEPFYGFTRTVALGDARTNLRVVERALELGAVAAITDEVRAAVEGYNRDDCLSALRLRDWLERLRASVKQEGRRCRGQSPRMAPLRRSSMTRPPGQALMAALTAGVPRIAASGTRSSKRDGCSRTCSTGIGARTRRRGGSSSGCAICPKTNCSTKRRRSRACVSSRGSAERRGALSIATPTRRRTRTFARATSCIFRTERASEASTTIDRVARTIDVKKRGAQADVHPSAVFAHSVVNSDVLAERFCASRDDVMQHGISTGRSIELRASFSLAGRHGFELAPLNKRATEAAVQFAVRIAADLDEPFSPSRALRVQGRLHRGPDDLRARSPRRARRGHRRESQGHPQAAQQVRKAAGEAGASGQLRSQGHDKERSAIAPSRRSPTTTSHRSAQAGGLTCSAAPRGCGRDRRSLGAVDVLFVDEAGQMSLANVLAASQAAQQRRAARRSAAARAAAARKPSRRRRRVGAGPHPAGPQDHSADRGIFLPETWRLAPSICAFTSEVFYEGRLDRAPGSNNRCSSGLHRFEGAGLWVAASHTKETRIRPAKRSSWSTASSTVCFAPALVGSTATARAADDRQRHPGRRAVQLPGRATRRTSRSAGSPRRHGRQVPGTGGPVVIYSMATSTRRMPHAAWSSSTASTD